MCNRCNECNHVYVNSRSRRSGCGCGCSHSCNSCDNNWNHDFDGQYDDEAFAEATRIIQRVDCRREKENRCARQFVCCMRNINNWD